MRIRLHNRYSLLWLHRLCCDALGAAVLAAIGSSSLSASAGSRRHGIGLCLEWDSIPVGILLGCIAHRFSIVEGLAGGAGYDELHPPNDHKTP